MPRKKAEKPVEEVVENNTIDMKKVMKDIDKYLDSKKDEIIESMKNSINNQIEINVNKRMKEEEKKIVRGKNMKILRRDLLILLLFMLVGYFGYCLYDVDYFNIRTKVVEVPNNNVEEKPKEEEKQVELDSEYYINKYRYLVDNMQIEDEAINELYSDNTSLSISNDLKLKIAYRNLSNSKKAISKETVTFKADDLLESAREIFGNNVTLENDIFSYNNTKFMFYSDTYLGFIASEEKTNLVYEVYDAIEKNDEVNLDVVVGKVENNVLFDSNSKVLTENFDQVKLSDYKDSLSKYKYTFTKNNDSYVFTSIKSI